MESKLEVKKGAWSHEEDLLLRKYIEEYGEGKWHQVPIKTGLNRTRKSCRLRWLNYLQPGIKRGDFKEDEIDLIMRLHRLLGNKWSLIAGRIPGRTDNEIKNYWNTHLIKRPEFQLPKPRRVEHEVIRPHALSLKSFKGKGISHGLCVSDQLPTKHDHGVISLREDAANLHSDLFGTVHLEQGPCSANVRDGAASTSSSTRNLTKEALNNILLCDGSINLDDFLNIDFGVMDGWSK